MSGLLSFQIRNVHQAFPFQVFIFYIATFTNIKHDYGDALFGQSKNLSFIFIMAIQLYYKVYATNELARRVRYIDNGF